MVSATQAAWSAAIFFVMVRFDTWVASPVDYSPKMARLSLKFDNESDGTHELHSIRLATWETPVLDKT